MFEVEFNYISGKDRGTYNSMADVLAVIESMHKAIGNEILDIKIHAL